MTQNFFECVIFSLKMQCKHERGPLSHENTREPASQQNKNRGRQKRNKKSNNGKHDGCFFIPLHFFSSFILNSNIQTYNCAYDEIIFLTASSSSLLIFSPSNSCVSFLMLHRFIIRWFFSFLYHRNCHKCILAILSFACFACVLIYRWIAFSFSSTLFGLCLYKWSDEFNRTQLMHFGLFALEINIYLYYFANNVHVVCSTQCHLKCTSIYIIIVTVCCC